MSCNNHTDILDEIINKDLADTKVHIVKNFQDPQSHAEMNSEFPYITFLMSDFTFDPNSLRVIQKIDVFGFVKSNDDLDEKRSLLLVTTATALKRRIKFDSGSVSNVFRPFGLNAFMDKPYAGFRLSGVIGFDLKSDLDNFKIHYNSAKLIEIYEIIVIVIFLCEFTSSTN